MPAAPRIVCSRRLARVSRLAPCVLLRTAPGRRRRLGEAGPSAWPVHVWAASRRGFDGGGGSWVERAPLACVWFCAPFLFTASARDGGGLWWVPTPIAVATMPRGSLDLTEETIKEFREAFALFVRWEGTDAAHGGGRPFCSRDV